MARQPTTNASKTFPIEMKEDLHRKLKIRAVNEGKSLHALILEILASSIRESATQEDRKSN